MKLQDIPSALSAIADEGRFRRVEDLRMVTASRGMRRDGKEYIVFNSNDYLGMTHESEVMAAARRAVIYGTGSGGARLTSGAVFELSELEKALAAFKHAEDAVIFNTGYMTNLGVLYALAGKGDVIFRCVESCEHRGWLPDFQSEGRRLCALRYGGPRPASGRDALRRTALHRDRWRFSMDGDICPLPALLSLKKKYEACLIVDDAHGVGVIGDTGRGTAEYYHESGIDIQVGTLSKSLGAEGGYAAASKEITDYLRNASRPFIFSTSISAVTGASALAALRLLEGNPSLYMGRLRFHTAYMKAKLSEAGIPVLPGDTSIIPIVIGDEKRTLAYAEACREDGILLSAIRPPTVPAGTSRIRLTVTAAHTKDELDRAAEVMKRHWR